jgi:transposase
MERVFSEEQFDRLYALLRQERRMHTGRRERERRFLEAVYWMSRGGAQWRYRPAEYGGWNSVYKRFARWDELGVWARLLAGVADEPDMQAVLIDATVIRAHACAAGAPKKTVGGWRRPSGVRAAASGRSCTSWSTPSATRSSAS